MTLCLKINVFGPIFTFLKKIGYGLIMVAFLCSDCSFYPSHYGTLDFPQQNGEQEQARQQVLVNTRTSPPTVL